MKKVFAFLLCIIMLIPMCAVAEDGAEAMLFDNEGNPIITLPNGETTAVYWGELHVTLKASSRPNIPVKDGVYDVFGVPCSKVPGYLGTDDKYHLLITLEDPFLGDYYAGILAENENVDSVMPILPDYNKNEEHRPLKRGDVNQNGKRDASDYAMAKRAYLGNYEITDESQFYCADVNGNGMIDTKDYAMIKRSYLGNYLIQFSSNLTENENIRNYIKDRFIRMFGPLDDVNSDGQINYTDIKGMRDKILVGEIYYGYGKDCNMFIVEVFDLTKEENKSNELYVYKYGDRTFALNSLVRVTDGDHFYTINQIYDMGLLTPLDLEDMCASFAISGVDTAFILK